MNIIIRTYQEKDLSDMSVYGMKWLKTGLLFPRKII